MKRPLVFAALLLISVILLLSAFGLPLAKTVREGTFLQENETRKGMLYGRLSRLSPSAGGWRLILEEAEFEESAEGAVNAASEAGPDPSGLRHAGTVLVYAGSEPEAPIGSLMRIRGSISLFPEPDNPGEFDQRAYYRAQNILLRMSADEVAPGAGPEASGTNPSGFMRASYRFREAARRVRKWLNEGIFAVFGEEEAGVLNALLLGDRSKLADELEDLYEAAGIRHILSVSGLHVSLAAGLFRSGLGWLLSFLPWQRLPGVLRRRGYLICRGLFAGLSVCFYTEVAGCGLPLRRAAVMILMLLLAEAAGQCYDLASALAFALLLAVLPCPYVLFQASFQLSFACVLVIGCAFPPLCRALHAETAALKTLLLPAFLQLATLPLQLWHYYVFHPAGFLANLLLLPLVMWILLFGLTAALLAHILLPAAVFAAGPAHFALQLIKTVCGLMRRLPFSTVILGRPYLWQILLYAVLAACMLRLLILRRKKAAESALTLIMDAGISPVRRLMSESRRCVLAVILLGWALPALFLLRPEDQALTVTSLYVGQGDCHVIRAEGRTYLIDGGSSYGSPARDKVIPYLKYEGIRRLSFVMASHGDEDHINALAEVLQADGLKVDELLLSGHDRGREQTAELEEAASACGTRIRSVFEGDILTSGGAAFRVLSPALAAAEEENDNSLVVLLSCGSFRGLFTGDIGAETEERLIRRYDSLLRELDYLKVAHHGSKNSSEAEFLALTSPAYAVISCGRNNRYGHPHEETLQRLTAAGCRIFRTDRCGALRITADGETITAGCFKKVKEEAEETDFVQNESFRLLHLPQ
ncbi:MAG: DNA internalization-related competence protein ComEC/Rec2 [Lachnospiraceae bacterium]|nr:DNA internalization-related competence protein ComEC/Rec2 [Lachnospiraceae bacterium]